MGWKKKTSLHNTKDRRKDFFKKKREFFLLRFFFFLLVRLLICWQMPRNIMKTNRDAAAERTAGNLQEDLTEPHSSVSPLKALCNETQMCDACVGGRLRAAAWLLLMLAPFYRICLQEHTSASFQASHLFSSPHIAQPRVLFHFCSSPWLI